MEKNKSIELLDEIKNGKKEKVVCIAKEKFLKLKKKKYVYSDNQNSFIGFINSQGVILEFMIKGIQIDYTNLKSGSQYELSYDTKKRKYKFVEIREKNIVDKSVYNAVIKALKETDDYWYENKKIKFELEHEKKLNIVINIGRVLLVILAGLIIVNMFITSIGVMVLAVMFYIFRFILKKQIVKIYM